MSFSTWCGTGGVVTWVGPTSNAFTCTPADTQIFYDVDNDITYTTAELEYITAVHESKLTYDDFVMLGGAILSMFILAWSLKQVRLIINNT